MSQIAIGELKKLKAVEIEDILPCEITSDGEVFALLLPACTVGMTQRILSLATMGKEPRKPKE